MHGRIRDAFCGMVVLAVLMGVTAGAAAQATPADFQKVLQDRSPAYVTVKFVLQVKMAGMGENESEMEITGAMIDPKGLVLVSNTQLGGIPTFMRMGREVTTTPTSIKILVGDDTEGLDARLMARDTELDLAWIQIKEAGDRRFAYVNLSNSGEARSGQPLVSVRRMGRFFDRTAVLVESRVAGVAKKPRRLYAPTMPLSSVLGLPIFTADNKVLGVAITQAPADEDGEQNPAAMLSRMSTMQDAMYGLILPAADVIEATERARQTAATQPADQADEDEAAPAPQPQADEDDEE